MVILIQIKGRRRGRCLNLLVKKINIHGYALGISMRLPVVLTKYEGMSDLQNKWIDFKGPSIFVRFMI